MGRQQYQEIENRVVHYHEKVAKLGKKTYQKFVSEG